MMAEKDLRMMVDHRMKVGCQCNTVVNRVNSILGCIRQCVVSRAKEVILPPYSVLVRPQLVFCVQL